MIPHRMVAWNGYNTVCGWQLREDDVSPIFTPLYHAGGLLAFLVPIFVIGGTIVLHHGFDTAEIWRHVERERATVVLGVPTIWKLLMDDPAFQTRRLPYHPIHARRFPPHVQDTLVAKADAITVEAIRLGGKVGSGLIQEADANIAHVFIYSWRSSFQSHRFREFILSIGTHSLKSAEIQKGHVFV